MRAGKMIGSSCLVAGSQLLAIAILMVGCTAPKSEGADTLYFGGSVVTMTGEEDVIEAVAVKDGLIYATGSTEELEGLCDDQTRRVDLNGHCLLPGFIDAHSHLAQGINAITEINVSCPPVGVCSSISDIVSRLTAESHGKEWILAWGYDNELIAEGRHPNVTDLDALFPDRPVVMAHVSGHMVVCNSKALEICNITKDTPQPVGGVIDKDDDGNLTGLLQENAAFALLPYIPQLSIEQKLSHFDEVMHLYASNGYTTIQEGLSDEPTLELLSAARDSGMYSLDVVALVEASYFASKKVDSSHVFNVYQDGLKLGGIKIIGDGSPQGKTAYFRKPYCVHGNCVLPMGFRGAPNLEKMALHSLFERAYSSDIQVFMHCNGDAAIDTFIEAHKANKGIREGADYRSVVIHSQFVQKDQLETYREERLIPSFFTNHCFFWGDVHRENLGEARANFLSPIASADSLGICYTNHTDYRITPLDPIFVLWTACNRISREGNVLGKNERASVYQALKGITINAAYQYFEEDQKGTIECGKHADFVVLSKNPLRQQPEQLRDIQILETIKDDHTVFNYENDHRGSR